MSRQRARTETSRVFLISGVPGQVRKDLAKKITTLGGKYFDIQDFKALCTHVICGRLSCSEKFLGACATGKWVLHPDYVHHSCSAGTWLDEEQYEWCDGAIRICHPQVSEELVYASRRWRFTLGEQGGAFTGWKVAVMSGASNSAVLKRLLISGGAEVFNLKLPIRNPAKVANTVGFVFVCDQNIHKVSTLFQYGVLCVRPNFIGDYLTKDPPADLMDYLVSQNLASEDGSPGGDTATTSSQATSTSSSQEPWLQTSQLSTPQKKGGTSEAAVDASPLSLFPSPYGQTHRGNVSSSTSTRPMSPYGQIHREMVSSTSVNARPTSPARKALFSGDTLLSPASSEITDLSDTLPSTRSSSQTTDIPSSETTDIPSSHTTDIPSSETTDIPSSETTDIPSSETTDIPSSKTTDIPSSETTDIPSSETTDIPSSETTDIPSSEATDIPSSEATDIPSSEASDIPSTLLSPSSSAGSCERNEPSTSVEELLSCAGQSIDQHISSSSNIKTSLHVISVQKEPKLTIIKSTNHSQSKSSGLSQSQTVSQRDDITKPESVVELSPSLSPACVKSSQAAHVDSPSAIERDDQSVTSTLVLDTPISAPSSQSGVCNQGIVIDLTLNDSSDDTEVLVIPCKPKMSPKMKSRRSTATKSSPAWKSLIPKSRIEKQSTKAAKVKEEVEDNIPKARVKKQSTKAAKVKEEIEDNSERVTPKTTTSTPCKAVPKRRLSSKYLLANMSPITKFFKPVTPDLNQVKKEIISPVKKELTSPEKKEITSPVKKVERVTLPPATSSYGCKTDDGHVDTVVADDTLRGSLAASTDISREGRDMFTFKQTQNASRNICDIDPLNNENVMRSETFDSETAKTSEIRINNESNEEKSNCIKIDSNGRACEDTVMECDDAELEIGPTVVKRGKFDDAIDHDSASCPDVDTDYGQVEGKPLGIKMNSNNPEGTKTQVTAYLAGASTSDKDRRKSIEDTGSQHIDIQPCQSDNVLRRSPRVNARAVEDQRTAAVAAGSTISGPVMGLRARVKEQEMRSALHTVGREKVSRSEWCPSVWICNQKQREVQDDVAMEISDPLTQIMFAVLDEEYVTVLREILVQTSLKSYPRPTLITTLIHKVFLTNGTDVEVNLMYEVLMKMIRLHPPTTTAMQEMYMDVLIGIYGHKDRQIGEVWNVIKQCVSQLLTERDDPIRTRSRLLLLRFIKHLLKVNLQHEFQCSHGDGRLEKTGKNLLVKILWCPSYHVVHNNRCQGLMDLLLEGVNCYRAQGPTDRVVVKEVLQFVTWMMAMATEYCRVQECRTSSGLDSLGAQKTLVFVQNIASKFVSANIEDLPLLEYLFTSLQLPWLRVGVCQQMLNSLDDYLVTVDQDNAGSISMSLIVSRYMFLLPRFHVGVNARKSTLSILRTKPARRTVKMEKEVKGLFEKNDVNKRGSDKLIAKANKRNAKGETPMHTACIKNNVNTLRQLLSVPGINVNMTDFAGWTPLHEACNHGSVECVQELLKFVPSKTVEQSFFKDRIRCRKVDLLACNADGITPLHDAVMNDRQEVCRLLLQHGGARLLTPVTRWGYTPSELATTDEMVMLLLSFKPVKRKFSESQDSTFGSQDSYTSLDESRLCMPGEHLYHEVTTGEDGSRIYCNTRALQVYIDHVTTLLRSYITARNIPRIKQILTNTHHTRCAASRYGTKKIRLTYDKSSENQNMPHCEIATDRVSSSCDISKPSAAACNGSDYPEHSTNMATINHSTKNSSDSTDHNGSFSDEIKFYNSRVLHSPDEKEVPKLLLICCEEKENSRVCKQLFSDVTSCDSVSSKEDVEELRQDLKIVRNLSSHVNMFRNHVFRLCNPEDKAVIDSKLLELSLLVSYME